MRRSVCVSLAIALLLSARLDAAAPVYTPSFASVTLDGVRLGTDLDPSNLSLFPSVVYDPATATYHLWVLAGATQSLEGIRHATSTDGVHFTSTGNLSFAGGNPFPVYGAAAEPPLVFPRVATLGSDWKLLLWTHNDPTPGVTGDYNYNESVNSLGSDPATLAVAHQGPVYPTNGSGTYGQTTGPFGIVHGRLYVADDRPGGISTWNYNDTTPPGVDTPADRFQDLITGTGYVFFITHPGDPLGVYVHNIGRVLDQADGTLGVYYSLRYPDGSRVNKQIYYAQSGDDGQTWSLPVGIFSNGAAVRVDGAPNQFEFSHPETTLVGSRRVLYFSTKAADGAFVVATSAAQPPSPGSWSDLLGSGQGAGESGIAVVRASEGGYAIAARTLGLTSTAAFWLVKLDGTGEVEWQKLYTGTGTGSAFFPTALVEAADGGLVMAGHFSDLANAMWILKVDVTGAVVWSNNYSTCNGSCDNRIRALVRTADGGFAFASSVLGYFGAGKIDASGALLWIKVYPATIGDLAGAEALVEAPDGGLAIAGTFTGAGICRVLRTDASGTVVWDQQIGSDQRLPAGIVNRSGGGFALTGTVAGAPWVIALDDTGAVSWENTYSSLGAAAIVPSASGGYAVVSTFEQAALFELDGAGTPVWAKAFGALPSSLSTFHGLVPTFDGGYLAVGDDVVGTDSRLLAVKVDAGGGFVGCLDEEFSFPLQAMPTSLGASPLTALPVDETANTTVAVQAVTAAVTDASERIVCRATLPTELGPAALSVDPAGNGVGEPGEQFLTEPSWSNFGLIATFLSGHASALSDSNGLDTAAPDPDAAYGTVPSLATADCATATGDCFRFQFQSVSRPSQHWDTYADETLTISDPHHRFAKRWTIHAGLSFDDVAPTSGFYPFVENIFHNGITAGCGGLDYCPGSSTTRAQMAVFLLKSKHGASFVPPVCTGVFADVPCPSLFANWIEELAAEGITAGCGGGNYCPNDAVTRQQMSAFLLKALIGSGYQPPACAGFFGDVACPGLFTDWIEDLYNRQITAGCSASPLLYCPADANTRQQMAVFLVRTFSLVLYGP
jgi:hypothetical protein